MPRDTELGWGPRSRRSHIIVGYPDGRPVTRCGQHLPGLLDNRWLLAGEALPDRVCPGCANPGNVLGRDEDGVYFTADRRFTITRTTMGGGANGIGGWSDGHTAWRIEDTSGATPFGGGDLAGPVRNWITVDRLYEARALIDHIYNREDGRA